jgi:hypothetical protein
MSREQAGDFLRSHGVRSGISECIVRPNARCPVCHQQVYFYANANGSKVYFDALGHPWPKHPCTDNGREPSIRDVQPKLFDLSKRRKLIEAAQISGLIKTSLVITNRQKQVDWNPVAAIAVTPGEFFTKVTAEFLLTTQALHQITFWVSAREANLSVGDLFSLRGSEISFLDKSTHQARQVSIEFNQPSTPPAASSWTIERPKTLQPPARRTEPRPTLPHPQLEATVPLMEHGGQSSAPKQEPAAPAQQATRSPREDTRLPFLVGPIYRFEDIRARSEPILNALARNGPVGGITFTAALNRQGILAANGSRWNPSAANLLLTVLRLGLRTNADVEAYVLTGEIKITPNEATPQKASYDAGGSQSLSEEFMLDCIASSSLA